MVVFGEAEEEAARQAQTPWLGQWRAGRGVPSSEEPFWRQPGPQGVSAPLKPEARTQSAGEHDSGPAVPCRAEEAGKGEVVCKIMSDRLLKLSLRGCPRTFYPS